MICKRISVEGFRNIESADVEFSDGVNVLVGNNAQGKTNLLEAIYFITLGKSFRSASESERYRSIFATLSVSRIFRFEFSATTESALNKTALRYSKCPTLWGSFAPFSSARSIFP